MNMIIRLHLRGLAERRERFPELMSLDIGTQVADENVIVTWNRFYHLYITYSNNNNNNNNNNKTV